MSSILTQGGISFSNWNLLGFFGVRQKSLHFNFKKTPYCVTISISYLRVGSQEPLIIRTCRLELTKIIKGAENIPSKLACSQYMGLHSSVGRALQR